MGGSSIPVEHLSDQDSGQGSPSSPAMTLTATDLVQGWVGAEVLARLQGHAAEAMPGGSWGAAHDSLGQAPGTAGQGKPGLSTFDAVRTPQWLALPVPGDGSCSTPGNAGSVLEGAVSGTWSPQRPRGGSVEGSGPGENPGSAHSPHSHHTSSRILRGNSSQLQSIPEAPPADSSSSSSGLDGAGQGQQALDELVLPMQPAQLVVQQTVRWPTVPSQQRDSWPAQAPQQRDPQPAQAVRAPAFSVTASLRRFTVPQSSLGGHPELVFRRANSTTAALPTLLSQPDPSSPPSLMRAYTAPLSGSPDARWRAPLAAATSAAAEGPRSGPGVHLTRQRVSQVTFAEPVRQELMVPNAAGGESAAAMTASGAGSSSSSHSHTGSTAAAPQPQAFRRAMSSGDLLRIQALHSRRRRWRVPGGSDGGTLAGGSSTGRHLMIPMAPLVEEEEEEEPELSDQRPPLRRSHSWDGLACHEDTTEGAAMARHRYRVRFQGLAAAMAETNSRVAGEHTALATATVTTAAAPTTASTIAGSPSRSASGGDWWGMFNVGPHPGQPLASARMSAPAAGGSWRAPELAAGPSLLLSLSASDQTTAAAPPPALPAWHAPALSSPRAPFIAQHDCARSAQPQYQQEFLLQHYDLGDPMNTNLPYLGSNSSPALLLGTSDSNCCLATATTTSTTMLPGASSCLLTGSQRMLPGAGSIGSTSSQVPSLHFPPHSLTGAGLSSDTTTLLAASHAPRYLPDMMQQQAGATVSWDGWRLPPLQDVSWGALRTGPRMPHQEPPSHSTPASEPFSASGPISQVHTNHMANPTNHITNPSNHITNPTNHITNPSNHMANLVDSLASLGLDATSPDVLMRIQATLADWPQRRRAAGPWSEGGGDSSVPHVTVATWGAHRGLSGVAGYVRSAGGDAARSAASSLALSAGLPSQPPPRVPGGVAGSLTYSSSHQHAVGRGSLTGQGGERVQGDSRAGSMREGERMMVPRGYDDDGTLIPLVVLDESGQLVAVPHRAVGPQRQPPHQQQQQAGVPMHLLNARDSAAFTGREDVLSNDNRSNDGSAAMATYSASGMPLRARKAQQTDSPQAPHGGQAPARGVVPPRRVGSTDSLHSLRLSTQAQPHQPATLSLHDPATDLIRQRHPAGPVHEERGRQCGRTNAAWADPGMLARVPAPASRYGSLQAVLLVLGGCVLLLNTLAMLYVLSAMHRMGARAT